ncbi:MULTISPECIES: ABC transporter [Rahnella]|uniref:ABC transporter n=1 Tax=Rahnella laticis TaxID=2787622 RepID=A0ABS0DZW5_9GAMM|nr:MULTISPECIES: ABC transporter [Rahnella]MBF7978370.1 ABC transporter [Rahnella laticis]MBF7997913.1 ABC transporter [Rahnella sp. LAC-M12]
MQFFTVWLSINLKCLQDRLFGYLYSFLLFLQRLSFRKHIPVELLLRFLNAKRLFRISSPHQRRLANVAHENQRCLLGDKIHIDFTLASERREILDYAATYGQNKEIIAQLNSFSDQLSAVVKPLHDSGIPVVLAPMHMVSDILAGIIAANVFPGKGTIIVSSNAEDYQEKDRSKAGVNLTYCSIHSNNEGIANNIMSTCFDAAEHKTNIILFPDIVPEYTHSSGAQFSSKIKCKLFNRSANIHSGVYRLARTLSAKIVFYHLYFDDGLKIYVHTPLESKDAPVEIPKLIESAITRHPQDWLLWHLHSLYFINK